MDPNYSAQDVARCDLCKTAIAQSYCDFCHVNLCKPCIGEHISADYGKHIIVSIQQRKSTLIYPKCEIHQDEDCKYQCKDCDTYVCYPCLASRRHVGHEFLNLDDIFKAKKKNARKDSEKLEKDIVPKFNVITLDLEWQLENLDKNYESVTKEMSEQRIKIYEEVDIVFNEMEKEISERKTKHRSTLKKDLDKIKNKQSLIQQYVVSLDDMEDSNDVISTTQYVSKNAEYSRIELDVKNITVPTFRPGKIDRLMLQQSFGKITSTQSNSEIELHKESLLDEPEMVSKVQTRHLKLRNVACLDDEKIWTSGETAHIKCFTIQGILQKTIKTKSGGRPSAIVADADGSQLYSDLEMRTVHKVNSKQTIEVIKLLGWMPVSLCVTSNSELLVTMYSDDETQCKVERFSSFTAKQTIQFDEEGQPLFSENGKIKYINENRNQDICVADCDAGAVVVVNHAGKLRFRYTADQPHGKSKPFRPRGITSDSLSRILIADGNNRCIHIIDVNGHFLEYIDTCNIQDPYGLCIDSNDNLFVCDYAKGNVKKIRYAK
uniref:Uncharacterized protein LOC111108673 n=1 Tax=Crassostrea virginica TaxID=6565 RepID=A0A8B8BBR4_CRAVI|nr:uncharacterized protein LOC111108673 [Crassostrea virginica]